MVLSFYLFILILSKLRWNSLRLSVCRQGLLDVGKDAGEAGDAGDAGDAGQVHAGYH